VAGPRRPSCRAMLQAPPTSPGAAAPADGGSSLWTWAALLPLAKRRPGPHPPSKHLERAEARPEPRRAPAGALLGGRPQRGQQAAERMRGLAAAAAAAGAEAGRAAEPWQGPAGPAAAVRAPRAAAGRWRVKGFAAGRVVGIAAGRRARVARRPPRRVALCRLRRGARRAAAAAGGRDRGAERVAACGRVCALPLRDACESGHGAAHVGRVQTRNA